MLAAEAAYCALEDDLQHYLYEAIVKGENLPKPGIPEAMNVLLHELRGLALSVKLE